MNTSIQPEEILDQLHRAVSADRAEFYDDALSLYQKSIPLLRTLVPSLIDTTHRRQVEMYISKLEVRVKDIQKALTVVAKPVHVNPDPQPIRPPPSIAVDDSKKVEVVEDNDDDHDDEDLLVGGDLDLDDITAAPMWKPTPAAPPPRAARTPVIPKQVPAKAVVSPPPPQVTPAKPAVVAPPPPIVAPKEQQPQLPPPVVSQAALKALDMATQYLQEGDVKKAIDYVGHAVDISEGLSRKPANLGDMKAMLEGLIEKYFATHPRRPVQDNKPTELESEVIKLSGKLTGYVFSAWDDPLHGYPRINVYLPPTMPWTDEWIPTLSTEQRTRTVGWKRISEFSTPESASPTTIVGPLVPTEICQALVADCSFVCSIMVCAQYETRFPRTRLISRVIFPQDAAGVPVFNPKGRYVVKLLVNGCVRAIPIDDKLPVDSESGMLICSHTRNNSEFCVPLIEKAFVKVFGGSYDFVGSTSSTDLYTLCGWLPEIVSLDSTEEGIGGSSGSTTGLDRDSVWQLLVSGTAEGRVLFTVNTPPELPPGVAEKLKLVPGHAYAGLDVKEALGNRLVKLRNPWAKQPWEGLFSINDNRRWTEEMREAFHYTKEEADNGIFWISWADTQKFFKRLHLSWNPFALFKGNTLYRVARHGLLDSKACTSDLMFFYQPQYHLLCDVPRDTKVYLLLVRHISSTTSERDEKKIPLICLHVFEASGKKASWNRQTKGQSGGGSSFMCLLGQCCGTRITSPHEEYDEVHRGIYRNTLHYLVQLNVPKGQHDYTVVVSSKSPSDSFSYSVTAYTEFKEPFVHLHEVPEKALPHGMTVRGSWKRGVNCGGNVGLPTLCYNPQYSFTLTKESHVNVVLTCKEAHAIGVHIAELTPSQSQLKKDYPWAHRIEEMSPELFLSIHKCQAYTPHSSRLCTYQDGYCIYYRQQDNNASSTGGGDEAVAIPPPSSPPPPDLMSLTICIANGQQFEDILFPHSTDVFPTDFILFALSKRVHAHVGSSKVVYNGSQLPLSQPIHDIPTGSQVFVVPGPSRSMTDDIGAVLEKVFGIAGSVVQLTHLSLSIPTKTADASAAVQPLLKEIIVEDETAMKLILLLDSMNDVPDEVKPLRKECIQDLQAAHDAFDRLKTNLSKLTTANMNPIGAVAGGTTGKGKTKEGTLEAKPLRPGTYTVVVSTFNKAEPGDYLLHVECTNKDMLDTFAEIPMEGTAATWNATTVQGNWNVNPHVHVLSLSSSSSLFVRLLVIGDGFEGRAWMELRKVGEQPHEGGGTPLLMSRKNSTKAWSLCGTISTPGEYQLLTYADSKCSNTFALKISLPKS